MAYPTIVRQDLADFTGRPVASFPETFVTNSAIPQAVLLFKLGTCIVDPALLSTDDQQLVRFALLSMADAIHLAAPYQTALANPFNSESIGSYSYSKTAKAVQDGKDTGVMWFDLAVRQLSQCESDAGDFRRGGIEMFERDGSYVSGQLSGNVAYLSPADMSLSRVFGYDPAPGQLTRAPSVFDLDVVPGTWVEDPPGSGLYLQEG